MKRVQSTRSSSPTPTTFSGISNYRTESYRPIRDKSSNAPAMPSLDPRFVARTHFDELSRYLASYLARVPFLPVRDDFHPKRNQARQKLATLPTSRFEDLSSDVYFELARRYPEFKDEVIRSSAYDDVPSPDFHATSHAYNAMGRSSEDTAFSRRKASQDIPRKSDERDRDFGRRPSASASIHSDSTGTTNAQSSTATTGMIIPNKSTIAEEDIEVPYGREIRDSAGTAVDERDKSQERSRELDMDGVTDGERENGEYANSRSPLGGLNGLSARLRGVDVDEDDNGGARSGEDYFDKVSLGRTSITSDRSAGASGMGSRLFSGRMSVGGEEHERLRRDYEYKIATMQSRITSLERDLGNSEGREQQLLDSQERVKQLEEDLDGFRRRAEEQSTAMRSLQKELDDLRELRAREKEREVRRTQDDEEELQILRDRCERLEEERGNYKARDDTEIVDQLRTDMEGLLTELSDLSRRNDELMTAKDSDLIIIRDLDSQLKDYKRKYEQAKTELRSVKATSQLFLQAPKSDDQLPMSSDGGLLDIHVTAFVSATDGLLTAARSNAPTRVLTPMKAVVTSVTAIIEDVRSYEQRPQRSDIDIENLRSLRERAEATLSNLATASKTHATSSGMSPVSLLDAAASHVSATVTEIGRLISIRKATKSEQEEFLSSPHMSSSTSFSPSLRSIDEIRLLHERKLSSSSSKRSDGYSSPLANSSRFAEPQNRRAPSEHSTVPEDAWAELRPYLEEQTESIVYAIQSVLSGVRSPVPSPTLNENLTQIITIVSSIVAVCNDNLPPASAQQGNEILQELSDHANKLSEVQALPEVTKESRQIMAKSSFAVANAMKGLMKL
ncbi:hypothetical protein SERLA73DRAFT_87202 [Serpula lacrymans var. lacrymans S7.3]|uniref:GIT Spa2 homology (SHD) domain-containing protein n=1 Tax=Serpula lacrymans var. lacrymans (strain S7.3) TaxID=936435 RepID=F8PT44_SERL3|nr:hypothetical protein SERLA73DRAFT_87202 [Serpula lacrymans var. lacrymans S7.3]